jgi:2,4-dienoyl-CoA reductase-like NADH-dependent reductase (Old Yellow Enzyme family)
MSKLLSPLKIREITLRNRIAISPMCMYSAVDGFANDWHLVHLGSRAAGGAGLIIQEATAVSPEGRITPGDLGLYKDEHIEMLQRITTFIHKQGAIAGIQLAHAGRKASCARPWEGGKQLKNTSDSWTIVAPSAIPFLPDDEAPQALNLEGIQKIISDFSIVAQRALKAGYKVIDIHAAHGYLVHQFLSPLSNHRTDSYGGNFENRIRLLLEIIDTVRNVWPSNLPLFVRLSATDWAEGGWNIDESVKLASILKNKGVDLIDTSAGGMVHNAKVTAGPGFMVAYAEQIKKESGILTSAVGLITQAQQAEDILQKDQADLILIARESLRNPNFALNAAKQLGDEIEWPRQYLRAK